MNTSTDPFTYYFNINDLCRLNNFTSYFYDDLNYYENIKNILNIINEKTY